MFDFYFWLDAELLASINANALYDEVVAATPGFDAPKIAKDNSIVWRDLTSLQCVYVQRLLYSVIEKYSANCCALMNNKRLDLAVKSVRS